MFEWLATSTWGVPIAGALHVLGVAWFGGLVLVDNAGKWRKWRWLAAAFLTLTGAVLFLTNPARTWASVFFRIKLALLVCLLLLPARFRRTSIALWIAVILASRGMAFY